MLKSFGVDCYEFEDGFEIIGLREKFKSVVVNLYKDYRIVMVVFIMVCVVEGESIILDVECVLIFFLNFYDIFFLLIKKI